MIGDVMCIDTVSKNSAMKTLIALLPNGIRRNNVEKYAFALRVNKNILFPVQTKWTQDVTEALCIFLFTLCC